MSNPLDDLILDIIARIEAGVPPWRQAWMASADPRLPLRANGEPFSGSNAWLLAFSGAVRGYRSPYWFTFRQALAIDAPVAKGEKASPAILYKTRVLGEPTDGPDGGVADEAGDPRVLRYLKTYSVFNAEQLTDCPRAFLDIADPDPAARAATRNAVLDAIPARVEFGGGAACYVPALDLIRLPHPDAFNTPDDFLATKAHEQLHWSGAAHRLDRTFGKRFGDEAYAFEELVAEIWPQPISCGAAASPTSFSMRSPRPAALGAMAGRLCGSFHQPNGARSLAGLCRPAERSIPAVRR